MKTGMQEKIDFGNMCSKELLEYISFKIDFENEAIAAFTEFCSRFERKMIQRAEIYCLKFSYSSVIAMDIAHCTFARVWKYPTFDLAKSSSKNIEKAILLWLNKIMYTQLVKYEKVDSCAEPETEEDLSLIMTIDDLVEIKADAEENKKKLREKLSILDSAFLGLSDKHRIIYLTYRAYEITGKNLPRPLLKKLQNDLQLTQSTVRVYKKEANSHIENYLKARNGTR